MVGFEGSCLYHVKLKWRVISVVRKSLVRTKLPRLFLSMFGLMSFWTWSKSISTDVELFTKNKRNMTSSSGSPGDFTFNYFTGLLRIFLKSYT